MMLTCGRSAGIPERENIGVSTPDRTFVPLTHESTLIFIGPGAARRVREYPANWRDLSDIELYSLSWER